MAVVHVAHDCTLGDGVIIANNVVMGGHVEIGDGAVIGGAAALHQFVRIGRAAMVGGVSGVEADVVPFGSVIGNRARLAGLNVIGLRRRGVDKARLHTIRRLPHPCSAARACSPTAWRRCGNAVCRGAAGDGDAGFRQRAQQARADPRGEAAIQLAEEESVDGSRTRCDGGGPLSLDEPEGRDAKNPAPLSGEGRGRVESHRSASSRAAARCRAGWRMRRVAAGRPVFIVAGWLCRPGRHCRPFPHAAARLGAAGRIMAPAALRTAAGDIVLVGPVRRPSLLHLRPDAEARGCWPASAGPRSPAMTGSWPPSSACSATRGSACWARTRC